MGASTGQAKEKVCVGCYKNVSRLPRTKDAGGHYYCNPCWQKALQRHNAANQVDDPLAGFAPSPPLTQLNESTNQKQYDEHETNDVEPKNSEYNESEPEEIDYEAGVLVEQNALTPCGDCAGLFDYTCLKNVAGRAICIQCFAAKQLKFNTETEVQFENRRNVARSRAAKSEKKTKAKYRCFPFSALCWYRCCFCRGDFLRSGNT